MYLDRKELESLRGQKYTDEEWDKLVKQASDISIKQDYKNLDD